MKRLLLFVLLSCVTLAAEDLVAQWVSNPAVNTPLVTSFSDQRAFAVFSDGAGGFYMLWNTQSPSAVYAQRFDSVAVARWPVLRVADTSAAQLEATAIADTSGIFVAWVDYRSGTPRVVAQRIDRNGNRRWGRAGVPLGSPGDPQGLLALRGAGGYAVFWSDNRGTGRDIYGQLILPSGVPQWGAEGLPVVTAGGNQEKLAGATDGTRFFLTWVDSRSTGPGVYALAVSGSGIPLWTLNGILVSSVGYAHQAPSLLLQSTALFVAFSSIEEWSRNVYLRKLSFSGDTLWFFRRDENGAQENPQLAMVADSLVALFWEDKRAPLHHLYVQAIRDTGGPLAFPAQTLAVSPFDKQNLRVLGDGERLVVAWEDFRYGAWDLFAQLLDASLVPVWRAEGNPISIASGNQLSPLMVAIGDGGYAVVWQDFRAGFYQSRIYGQRVNRNGTLGTVTRVSDAVPPAMFALYQNYPNPFNPSTVIKFEVTSFKFVTLKVYNVIGKEVATLVNEELRPGSYEAMWDASGTASGTYFYRLQTDRFVATRKMALIR